MRKTERWTKKEYLVSFFRTNVDIELIINKITFKIATKKIEKKSKFGVQGPDLNSADKLIITTASKEIA